MVHHLNFLIKEKSHHSRMVVGSEGPIECTVIAVDIIGKMQ